MYYDSMCYVDSISLSPDLEHFVHLTFEDRTIWTKLENVSVGKESHKADKLMNMPKDRYHLTVGRVIEVSGVYPFRHIKVDAGNSITYEFVEVLPSNIEWHNINELLCEAKMYLFSETIWAVDIYPSKSKLNECRQAFKELAFILENSIFFQIHFIPLLELAHGMTIRLFDGKAYITKPTLTKGDLDDIRATF